MKHELPRITKVCKAREQKRERSEVNKSTLELELSNNHSWANEPIVLTNAQSFAVLHTTGQIESPKIVQSHSVQHIFQPISLTAESSPSTNHRMSKCSDRTSSKVSKAQ